MARPPGPGICIHCLLNVKKRNWDHVIPKAWYPEATPRDLEKWKVPSCLRCNAELGAIENDLLLRFGLCLDPTDVASAGISERALRGIKPEFAKNAKDRKAREAKRTRILSELIPVNSNMKGALPGFGFEETTDSSEAIPVPAATLMRFGEKVVRGITYIDSGNAITAQYNINVYFVRKTEDSYFDRALDAYAKRSHRGPGLVVERAVIPVDSIQGLFRCTIWGRFRFYASVRDAEDQAKESACETT